MSAQAIEFFQMRINAAAATGDHEFARLLGKVFIELEEFIQQRGGEL